MKEINENIAHKDIHMGVHEQINTNKKRCKL